MEERCSLGLNANIARYKHEHKINTSDSQNQITSTYICRILQCLVLFSHIQHGSIPYSWEDRDKGLKRPRELTNKLESIMSNAYLCFLLSELL